jgi:hypothetical protein
VPSMPRHVARLLIVALLVAAGCGGAPAPSPDHAASGAPAETPTADPRTDARSDARALAKRGRYAAAAARLTSSGLRGDARRTKRIGARKLYRSAQRALDGGHYKTAKRLAAQSRQLRRTAAAAAVVSAANTGIAKAEAAARERRRLAAIARDQRTCSAAEKGTVRDGGTTPPGCAAYAAERARKQQAAQCDPNYTGACLKPDSPDYDCEGGSGDGPDYTGAVQSIGSDPYDLDRDGDGSACEG